MTAVASNGFTDCKDKTLRGSEEKQRHWGEKEGGIHTRDKPCE